jgi:hypothetical protein
MLEKARDDPGIKRTQFKNIQKNVGKMCDLIFDGHQSTKYSDELISKIHYSFVDIIKQAKDYFEETKFRHKGKSFVGDPEAKRLLNELPFDEAFTLEDKANAVLQEGRPGDLAVEFVATTIIQMQKHDNRLPKFEDRDSAELYVRKKIKKIYRNT